MLGLIWVAALISACATVTHTESALPTASPIHPGADALFSYPDEPVISHDQLIGSRGRYELHRVTFPSISENGQSGNLVEVEYHQSQTAGPHPVVIVLPIWGRHVYPSNAVIRTLRKRSNGRVHILNVLGTEFLVDWPKLGTLTDEDQFIETWIDGANHEIATLNDLRRLIDWAEDRAEIDADRVGLIGFSHGAMLAPALAVQEPRLTASVLVMGGADAHEVIARCIGARTEGIQDHAFETFGWTRDDMAATLKPIYAPLNAANYPNRVDPTRVLIFDAAKDECVPQSSRDSLWEAMGRPERYTINANHRHAFYTMTPLRFNWMRMKIWDFFQSRLLEGSTHSNSDRR